jgi:hypothetical protein
VGTGKPQARQAIVAEAIVGDDGSLHIIGPRAGLSPGDRVTLRISSVSIPDGKSSEKLRGTVVSYDDPFEPVAAPDDWEAARSC